MKMNKIVLTLGLLLVLGMTAYGEVVLTSGDPFTGGISYRWTLAGMDTEVVRIMGTTSHRLATSRERLRRKVSIFRKNTKQR